MCYLSFGNSNPYYTRYTLARASSSRNQIPPYRSKADNFWRTNIHLELIYRCLSFGRNSSVTVSFSFKFLNRDGKKLTLQFHQRDIFLLKLLKHTQMLFLKILLSFLQLCAKITSFNVTLSKMMNLHLYSGIPNQHGCNGVRTSQRDLLQC